MIHDIILNMLSPNLSTMPLSVFLVSFFFSLFPIVVINYLFFNCSQHKDVSKDFFHPCEEKLLRDIIKWAELHRGIKKFILKYSSQASASAYTDSETDEAIPNGLYLQALADSLDTVLDPFRKKLLVLEKEQIQNPNLSLSYFFTEIKEFETFFYFLQRFINELRSQKLHGCAILTLLSKHTFHGDAKVMEAIKTIRKGVYAVFLRQLSQWLIYGRLVDLHEEFFIVHCDLMNKSKLGGTRQSVTGTVATISETTSVSSDLWQYQIAYELLPPNFTPSWAEKTLFIGQTVRMLNDDPRRIAKKMSIWNDDDQYNTETGSLWNKQEDFYFNKIQTLFNSSSIDVGAYERIVNEIKLYVTERLSEIAFNQADLIKHLRLVKDYFLLGRGELFLEFIIQTESITATRDNINEHLARDVNKAFQSALNRTFIDLEQITMHLPIEDQEFELSSEFNDDPYCYLQLINLKFNVKWPLHLFFSPIILRRYNQLFRFLLQIRKIQNDLHTVWRLHRERKEGGSSMMSQLRNKLLFLIDNLQYYLQVDVLESQFSILINAVQNSKDFEFIQRAHSVFQANIMSLCFLLNSGTNESANMLNSTSVNVRLMEAENPVLTILKKIMQTIRQFCDLNENCSSPLTLEQQHQLELNDTL